MKIVTLEHTAELYADVMANMLDYCQTGETVCGTEDPAVIDVSVKLAAKYPELAGLTVVRVTDRYVSPWKSDTYLEFSNIPMTEEETSLYDEYVDGMD